MIVKRVFLCPTSLCLDDYKYIAIDETFYKNDCKDTVIDEPFLKDKH